MIPLKCSEDPSHRARTSRTVNDVLAGQYHSAFKGRGMGFEEVRQCRSVTTCGYRLERLGRVSEPHVKIFRRNRS